MPPDIICNSHFKRFVCIKLSPNLISFLDIADHNAAIKPTASAAASSSSPGSTNASSSSKASFWRRREKELRLTEANVRTLLSITVEMARLLGPSAEMRPLLESLFHRAVVCSQPKNRALPLHYLTELFADAERLLQIAVYAPEADEIGEKMEEDFDAMSLFKL